MSLIKLSFSIFFIATVVFGTYKKASADKRTINFITKVAPRLASARGYDYLPSSSDSRPINKTHKNITKSIEKISSDPENIATLYYSGGNLIYEKYNYGIDASLPLYGFSMTKTAVALMLLNLQCQGKLDISKNFGELSSRLNDTVYRNIKIENALLMASGVISSKTHKEIQKPLWRKFIRRVVTPIEAINQIGNIATKQGTVFAYAVSDTLALGMLVEDASKEKLSKYFSETIFKHMLPEHDGYWQVAKNGENIGAYGLMLSARDWVRLGIYIINQISSDKCMARHFKTMRSNSITGQYGYQIWLDQADDGRFRLTGHSGQYVAFDIQNGDILVVFSGGKNYEAGMIYNLLWEILSDQALIGK